MRIGQRNRNGSLAGQLLRGGEWDGVRVMGCGERLAVIGISFVISFAVSLWVAPKVARLAVGRAERDFLRRRAASVGQPAGVLALEGVGVGHAHGALENPEFPFVHADDSTENDATAQR